ncbi:hypothetical protein QQ045_008278 [Rhodiola kirilowii]
MQPTNKVKGKGFALVHGKIKVNQQEIMMNFLNVYAPRLEKEKPQLWESLVELKATNSGEWVIGGDFNSVLAEEERSNSIFNGKDANLFQDFIQAMEVLDLLLKGRRFTWGNKNGASRLDRFLISPGVLSSWPKIEQVGLEKGPSDHVVVPVSVGEKSWGIRPFRILNAWLDHPGLKGRVKEAWSYVEVQGWKGFTIQRRLARVRSMLSHWNKKSFGDIRAKLIKTREEWERLSLLQDSRNLSEEESLRKLALQKIIWLLEV